MIACALVGESGTLRALVTHGNVEQREINLTHDVVAV
jgi:hypothetical protein